MTDKERYLQEVKKVMSEYRTIEKDIVYLVIYATEFNEIGIDEYTQDNFEEGMIENKFYYESCCNAYSILKVK